ncbi:translation initiation factor IF-2-like [Vulpes lagopus]|uniref:translation initiation factor IF-2-like n=1 Tax=Vulpes lagopus TaxID=494514 RepID=UPI001BCA09AD|nr:translation initiation factor IF-2-like [Vulpes lagopus]
MTEITNVDKDVVKREQLCTVGGNANWCSHCGKQHWSKPRDFRELREGRIRARRKDTKTPRPRRPTGERPLRGAWPEAAPPGSPAATRPRFTPPQEAVVASARRAPRSPRLEPVTLQSGDSAPRGRGAPEAAPPGPPSRPASRREDGRDAPRSPTCQTPTRTRPRPRPPRPGAPTAGPPAANSPGPRGKGAPGGYGEREESGRLQAPVRAPRSRRPAAAAPPVSCSARGSAGGGRRRPPGAGRADGGGAARGASPSARSCLRPGVGCEWTPAACQGGVGPAPRVSASERLPRTLLGSRSGRRCAGGPDLRTPRPRMGAPGLSPSRGGGFAALRGRGPKPKPPNGRAKLDSQPQ